MVLHNWLDNHIKVTMYSQQRNLFEDLLYTDDKKSFYQNAANQIL